MTTEDVGEVQTQISHHSPDEPERGQEMKTDEPETENPFEGLQIQVSTVLDHLHEPRDILKSDFKILDIFVRGVKGYVDQVGVGGKLLNKLHDLAEDILSLQKQAKKRRNNALMVSEFYRHIKFKL